MENQTHPTWQKRFDLTTCAALALEQTIPPTALGVAVIYAAGAESGTTAAKDAADEMIYLVIESRAGSLLAQCLKRLNTSKLPPASALTVAFKAETLAEASPEAVHAACREQVILAGELRRELRPAMR